MLINGQFTDSDDTEYRYKARVHLDADYMIEIDRRGKDKRGNSILDLELNIYCELTDEWLDVDQDHDIFYERELEDKVNQVINAQWTKHDLNIDREEQRLGV